MKRITTNTALEDSAFSVSPANVSATIASLAGVVAINNDYTFAKHFGFVLDEAQELPCAPASNEASGFFPCPTFAFHTARFQFFDGDSIAILVDDCFRDAMVYISDEPSLSPGQPLQVSFCGTSACSLKASLQMLISPFDSTEPFAVEKSVITRNCWIVNSSVNSNDFFDNSPFWSWSFNDDVKECSAFFCSDSCTIRTFEFVLFKVRGDFDGIFSSAGDCAQTNQFRIGQEPESVVIEPDRTISFFGGFLFEFEPFEHIAGLVPDSSHETAVEFRMCGSNNFVCELVQRCFIESVLSHTYVNTFLAGLIAQADCFSEVFVSDNFSSYCQLHNTPLDSKVFECIVLSPFYENQKNKARSLQHQLSSSLVSEVPQTGAGWRTQNFSREHHKRSLHAKRLGAHQLVCATRPLACIPVSATNIQPYVGGQSFERGNSSEGCEGASFCGEVLESELLCWNSRNGYRANYSEVYSRTRNEVKVLIPRCNKIAVSPQHT